MQKITKFTKTEDGRMWSRFLNEPESICDTYKDEDEFFKFNRLYHKAIYQDGEVQRLYFIMKQVVDFIEEKDIYSLNKFAKLFCNKQYPRVYFKAFLLDTDFLKTNEIFKDTYFKLKELYNTNEI